MSSVNRARIRRGPSADAPLAAALYSGSGPERTPDITSNGVDGTARAATHPDLSTRLRLVQRALQSRVQRRDALVDVVRAVNTTLDPARVAEMIVDRAASWVPAPGWAVVSSDLSGQLTVLCDHGLMAQARPALAEVARWVMAQGTEFVTADLRTDPRVPDAADGTVLAFPLSSRGRRIGALIAIDPTPSAREPRLPPRTLRAIRVLLEPAGAALDNAVLFKRAEALSVTDDLTRLYNSRYLKLVLRRETKRATRNGKPLSLLFLDIDGFKSVNDGHGHLSGSRALVEAAAIIRGSARETDVVARFGGDEFALVLPDTGSSGAWAVADRVRRRIAEHRFLEAEGLALHLTISLGIATLPDDAVSPDELVQAADTAMYRVKQSGKNGIQAAAVLSGQ